MTSQRFRVIHSVDWRLALLVAVVLLALQGCASTVRVRTDAHTYGTGVRAYLTIGHVTAKGGDVWVGNLRCDVVALSPGPDPVTLLIPRGEPGTVRYPYPGTSGSPAYDALGRYVGALVGYRNGAGVPVVARLADGGWEDWPHGRR